MNDLWIEHISIKEWSGPKLWTYYFGRAQELLGSPLTHLDIEDPVRRKLTSLEEAGDFVCAFGPREDSRWLFGQFKEAGIDFEIRHFRQLDRWPNSLTWHVPLSFLEDSEKRQRLKELFYWGNQAFNPFYGYADERAQITKKKKPSGFAVDIRAELLGAFWLTYFNSAYVEFFGKGKFSNLYGVEYGNDGSATFVLGESPQLIASGRREIAEATLGKQSFVDPNDILDKPPGRFALTFQQLINFQKEGKFMSAMT